MYKDYVGTTNLLKKFRKLWQQNLYDSRTIYKIDSYCIKLNSYDENAYPMLRYPSCAMA